MLQMSISPEQRDWVHKMPAIEFAFNSVSSSVTGYSLFFLNFGRHPQGVAWHVNDAKLPGIRKFLNRMQAGLEISHQVILQMRIKQECTANRRCHPAPF